MKAYLKRTLVREGTILIGVLSLVFILLVTALILDKFLVENAILFFLLTVFTGAGYAVYLVVKFIRWFFTTKKIRPLVRREILVLLGFLALGLLVSVVGFGKQVVLEGDVGSKEYSGTFSMNKVGLFIATMGYPIYLTFRVALYWAKRCGKYPF